MPKISVNKYKNFTFTRKDKKVWSSEKFWVTSESNSINPKVFCQKQFDLCILAADAGHNPAAFLFGEDIRQAINP